MNGLSIGIGVGLKYNRPILGKMNIGEIQPQMPSPIAAWSAAGKTNEDEDRAILKDLTGNGHDITLNGFAFSEMSGYGGYTTEFDSTKGWTIFNNENYLNIVHTKTKAILKPTSTGAFITNNLRYTKFYELFIRCKTNADCNFNISTTINDESNAEKIGIIANQDTLIHIEDVNNIEGLTRRYCHWDIPKENCPEEGFIIELLPEYPDALVFDGVDDYGVCDNMPIQTDYTLIYKRIYLSKPTTINSTLFSKRIETSREDGAFQIERFEDAGYVLYSFGEYNVINLNERSIGFCTKNNYNGVNINSGNKLDSAYFRINGLRGSSMGGATINFAFYCAYLFDRSLTEEEIKAFIRKNIDPEYILPSEQETTE